MVLKIVIRSLILTIVATLVSGIYYRNIGYGTGAGFPFPYLIFWKFPSASFLGEPSFNVWYFLLDIGFWFVVPATVVFAVSAIGKEQQKVKTISTLRACSRNPDSRLIDKKPMCHLPASIQRKSHCY